jgi:hypothetical protein
MVPVSQEEYEAAQRGYFGTVAQAAKDFIDDEAVETGMIASGTGSNFISRAMGRAVNPVTEFGEQQQALNDERQAAMREVYPGANLMGQGVGFGITAAIPSAPPVSAPSRAVTAFQRGAARGSKAVRDRSVGAAGNIAGAADRGSGKTSVITAEQADNLGWNLSPVQRNLLEARHSGDLERVRKAEQAMANADARRKTSLPGVNVGVADVQDLTSRWSRPDPNELFTREVADQLGLHDVARITPEELRYAKDESRDVFKVAFDEGNFPVQTRWMDDDGTQIDVMNLVRDAVATDPAPTTALKNAVKRLEGSAKRAATEGKHGEFDIQSLLQARGEVRDAANTAYKTGKYDSGQSLSYVSEVIESALEQALPPDLAAEVALERFKWKIAKTIEHTTGVQKRGFEGKLNVAAFAQNWRGKTLGLKNSSREMTEFEKIMHTLRELDTDYSHAGNTLYRAFNPAFKIGTVGLVGSSLLD